MNNIITSLFICKSQLYSSSLDGNIIQTNIETNYRDRESIEFNINNSPYAKPTSNPTDCRRAVNSSIAT